MPNIIDNSNGYRQNYDFSNRNPFNIINNGANYIKIFEKNSTLENVPLNNQNLNNFKQNECCYCQTNNSGQNIQSQSIRRRYTVNNLGSGYLINRYTNGMPNPNIVDNNNNNNNNNNNDNNNNNVLTTTVANENNQQTNNIQTKTNAIDCICCVLNNNGDNYIQSYNFGKKRETKRKLRYFNGNALNQGNGYKQNYIQKQFNNNHNGYIQAQNYYENQLNRNEAKIENAYIQNGNIMGRHMNSTQLKL